jgi:diketogulonate reductase-like aldo/keto reductase
MCPLAETLKGFQSLNQAGKIREYGVSNFDMDDMEEASGLLGGDEIATDQVLYNLVHRGIEWDFLPWCRERRLPVIAYSPIEHSSIEQRGMLDHPHLKLIASRHRATPAQVALAWLLRQQVVVIPKASYTAHVRENRAALDLALTNENMIELDCAFPPSRKQVPLEMR